MPINVYTGLRRSGKSYEVFSEVIACKSDAGISPAARKISRKEIVFVAALPVVTAPLSLYLAWPFLQRLFHMAILSFISMMPLLGEVSRLFACMASSFGSR